MGHLTSLCGLIPWNTRT